MAIAVVRVSRSFHAWWLGEVHPVGYGHGVVPRGTYDRFRQEDGFRDHKQRLGMEECRAWTKEPILRTFQVKMVGQTLLRVMQFRLEAIDGNAWCSPPPWNLGKRHVSILDLRRLFWKHRQRFSKVLAALDDLQKPPQAKFHCGRTTARAA
jgi:hypothetical protein